MKKHPYINAEEFHAHLLEGVKKYAMSEAPPGKYVRAFLLEPTGMDAIIESDPELDPFENLMDRIEKLDEFDGLVYKRCGSFSLPPESAELILSMARCTLVTLVPTAPIEGFENLRDVPFEAFSLGDLLSVGYPRNTRSGIMKGTIGATFIDGYEADDEFLDRMEEEVSLHRRFAGLCVIIMNETRKALGELIEDDEVLKMAWEKELVICLIK